MSNDNIVIPYKPRPLWEKVLHPALDEYRFAVLVCHRRFGKTVGCVNQMIKEALLCDKPAPRLCYLAPFRNQAKLIAWEYLKHYTSVIPAVDPNESDLSIELPSKHAGWAGAKLYIVGADKPNNLRGAYWDYVILDEYAQIKKELWSEIIRPALADRGGKAVFIGTPRGQNQFYDMYKGAENKADWFAYRCTVDESGVLSADELESMKADMTDMAIRQELYCDFTASASDVVITLDEVEKARNRELTDADVAGSRYVLGVDVARFGDDATVITARRGLHCEPQRVYRGLDTMAVADRVIEAMRQYNPVAVFIDVGAMGAGVVDRLHQLNYHVTEVSFSGTAMDSTRYANRRAEMYFKSKEWLNLGGALPYDSDDLRTELSTVEYHFTATGKIQLEPKEKLKERIGKSPDFADSFVLTFAMPVYTPPTRAMEYDEEEAYDPWKDYK